MPDEKARLEGLDALRGVAAIAVVVWHIKLHNLLGLAPFKTHAYLAVDLFFMLSGFVLAHVYGGRLQQGGGFRNFVRARLTRLYPLHLLGAGLGILALTAARPTEAAGLGGQGLAVLAVLAALFLPWTFGGAAGADAFPLNPPSWSLSLEMWGNLAYGLLARRLGPRALIACVAVSALVLVEMALAGGSLNYGWRQGDIWLGWPRFAFAFSVGLGLHRLWAAGRLKPRRLPDWSLALVLGAVLVAPRGGRLDAVFDLVAVLAVFPLLVTLAAGAAGDSRASPLLAIGGRLSYPLYAVHWPVVTLSQAFAVGLGLGPQATTKIAVFALISSLAAAFAAERWFDRPLRAWMGRRRVGIGLPQPVSAA